MTAAQEQALDKIRKLLRLGRRTEHRAEAEAALAKAAELAEAAGLEIAGIDADAQAARITHEAGGARRRSHSRVRAACILRGHFGVAVIGSSDRGCIYVGPLVNIAIARHVEEYLVARAADGWREEAAMRRKQGRRVTGETRRAWEFGFYAGIGDVLARRPIRNDAGTAEIMAGIERYKAENFNVQSAPIGVPSRRHDAAVFNGIAKGVTTPVDRPVGAGAARRALASAVRKGDES